MALRFLGWTLLWPNKGSLKSWAFLLLTPPLLTIVPKGWKVAPSTPQRSAWEKGGETREKSQDCRAERMKLSSVTVQAISRGPPNSAPTFAASRGPQRWCPPAAAPSIGRTAQDAAVPRSGATLPMLQVAEPRGGHRWRAQIGWRRAEGGLHLRH